ncbi:hypothetical protein ABZV77_11395 [Streptomyces sp. NPDC004732]|uniref:hypothetical protein n=1 Tax=Streptomyces sp. NPDC004732 TaxID=3154290 RepID=UPI0033A2CB74
MRTEIVLEASTSHEVSVKALIDFTNRLALMIPKDREFFYVSVDATGNLVFKDSE